MYQPHQAAAIAAVADLFEGSPYHHQSVDLYPGKSIIKADLNTFTVPAEYRGAFDLFFCAKAGVMANTKRTASIVVRNVSSTLFDRGEES